jgi:DNA-binding FadR family transcriptional regulator
MSRIAAAKQAPVAPALRSPNSTSPSESAFAALLADIVSGTFAAGTNLPAERDLARRLGTSRPTLREALRRLAGWNLVDPRRGSGVVVRERRDWSIEVLPAYLRHGAAQEGEPAQLATLVEDLLTLRRSLMLETVLLIAKRMPPGGTDGAGRQLETAWSLREDPVAFVEADLGVMRALVEAAGFLPAVWLLNRLAGVYLDLARLFTGAVTPPSDYREAHRTFLTAVERHQPRAAARVLRAYLERHDRRLLRYLKTE